MSICRTRLPSHNARCGCVRSASILFEDRSLIEEVVLFLGVVYVRCGYPQRFHPASEETQACALRRERLPQTTESDGSADQWIHLAQDQGKSILNTEASSRFLTSHQSQ